MKRVKESNSEKFNKRLTEIISMKGATSSKLEIDFHDIPYDAMAAAGRRFFYGRKRHGRFNWKQGDARFAEERLKHLVNHMMLFCEERQQEDLDAIMCNAAMLCWFYKHGILSKNPFKDFLLDDKEDKK